MKSKNIYLQIRRKRIQLGNSIINLFQSPGVNGASSDEKQKHLRI